MKIYLITNTINDKKYVGQTVQTLKQRFARHSWKCNNGRSAIASAIQKYGKDEFTIELIEECTSQTELNIRELYWIEYYNTLSPNGYNLRSTIDGRGSCSEETKLKISKANKGRKASLETIERLRKSHLGQQMSEETKKKLSKLWSGIRPCKLAQENNYKAKTKIYQMLSPTGEHVQIIDMAKFCKENGYCKGKMSELVQGKRQIYRGWKHISSNYLIEKNGTLDE